MTSRDEYEGDIFALEKSSAHTNEQKQNILLKMMVEILLDIRDGVERMNQVENVKSLI